MRILVVEDETYNRKMVEYLMKSEGYDVDEVDNPQGALQMMDRRMPDLILLDINFGPKNLNGFELFSRIRDKYAEVPIIFVTSRHDLDDRLRGLNLGADDYILKPYAPAEVVARVRGVLHRVYRRTPTQQQQVLHFDGIELNVADLCVTLPNRKPILLTPTEMKLLMYLMQHAEQIVPRDTLLAAVWGDNYPGESNIVDSFVRKLRIKIELSPAKPYFIRTARGAGYKFSTRPES